MTSAPLTFANRRLGVLISGRGSNLQSLITAIASGRLQATIAIVISNNPDAAGLERAREAGIDAVCLDHRGWASRADYDRELVRTLAAHRVDLVCLAGFMRLIGAPVLAAFPNAILNIHPSLLPAFPGVNAQQQAIDHGVRVSGVTVHFVDEGLDTGAIVLQRPVPVHEDDTAQTLAARILDEEHQAYPEAVQQVLDGGGRIDGRRWVRGAGAAG